MGARPVVVIAALRRTGSTLLSELLSQLPRAFVFREPRLLRGRLALKDDDVARFAALGIDLRPLAAAPRPATPTDAARRFAEELLPRVSGAVEQVGFKEIRYGPRWASVLAALPAHRVVATARDPRDIYLSLRHAAPYVRARRIERPDAPEDVAGELRREWRHQRELIGATGAMRLRYEDLCTDPSRLPAVLAHVQSPLDDAGSVGAFRPTLAHGGRVSDLRVERWRREPDRDAAAGAHRVAELLEDYCEFWGYDPP